MKLLFDRFVADVDTSGTRPLILLFPNKVDVRTFNKRQPKTYAPLLNHFREQGFVFVDFLDVFENHYGKLLPSKKMFGHSHDTREVNKIVGEYLVGRVGESGVQSVMKEK